MTVFREYYEVTGTAKKSAEKFAAEQLYATDTQWKLVKSFGAKGYRPSYDGYIHSLFFSARAKIPDGLRKIGRDKDGDEFKPDLRNKVGRQIRDQFAAVAKVPNWREFANTFNWKGRSPMGMEGGRAMIYRCNGIRVVKPRVRVFLTYPRERKDGWKPPAGLKQVRESDMLRAIEDHNAALYQTKVRNVER